LQLVSKTFCFVDQLIFCENVALLFVVADNLIVWAKGGSHRDFVPLRNIAI
jgi:hypothetical protein